MGREDLSNVKKRNRCLRQRSKWGIWVIKREREKLMILIREGKRGWINSKEVKENFVFENDQRERGKDQRKLRHWDRKKEKEKEWRWWEIVCNFKRVTDHGFWMASKINRKKERKSKGRISVQKTDRQADRERSEWKEKWKDIES